MSNQISVTLPNGKAEVIPYSNIGEVQFYLNSKGCGNVLKPEVLERNKSLLFQVPTNFPKSRKTELKNCLIGFGMFESQIEYTDEVQAWESGFGGGTLDSRKAMESKGFKGSFEDYHKLIQAIKSACEILDSNMAFGRCSFAIPLRKKAEDTK